MATDNSGNILPRPMTARQEHYCQEYSSNGGDMVLAYRIAYNTTSAKPATIAANARKLMRNPAIERRLDHLSERIADTNNLSISWVLDGLRDNFNRAMQAVPVVDREGNAIGMYNYDGKSANRALELIGKHLGMWRGDAALQIANALIAQVAPIFVQVNLIGDPEERKKEFALLFDRVLREQMGQRMLGAGVGVDTGQVVEAG